MTFKLNDDDDDSDYKSPIMQCRCGEHLVVHAMATISSEQTIALFCDECGTKYSEV